MHKQCPVLYNNSYSYGLTTRYIITVIPTYVHTCNGCTLLLRWIVLVLSWVTYLLVAMYWYLLILTYLRTYLLAHLLGYTCM